MSKRVLIVLLAAIPIIVAIFLFMNQANIFDFQIRQNGGNREEVSNMNKKKDAPDKGDPLYGLGDGYAYFGRNAYYNGKLLEGVDAGEFESLGGNYAKSAYKVFYEGILIENADAKTFKIDDSKLFIFTDKDRAYHAGQQISLSAVEKLKNFLTKDIGGVNLGNNYRRYDGRVYYWLDGRPHAVPVMILIDADPAKFVSFTGKNCTDELHMVDRISCARYGKDDKKVFTDSYEIKGVDSKTFELLGGGYSKDKVSVLFAGRYKLENVEVNLFKVLDDGYGKDKNKVFYGEKEIFGADPDTFKLLAKNNGLGGRYGKDKDSVFFGEREVVGADVETFRVIGPENTSAQDENNKYWEDKVVGSF